MYMYIYIYIYIYISPKVAKSKNVKFDRTMTNVSYLNICLSNLTHFDIVEFAFPSHILNFVTIVQFFVFVFFVVL